MNAIHKTAWKKYLCDDLDFLRLWFKLTYVSNTLPTFCELRLFLLLELFLPDYDPEKNWNTESQDFDQEYIEITSEFFFFFFVKKQKEKSSIWYSLSYPDIYSCGKNKCIVYLFITFLFGHIIVITMMFNLNDFPDEQKKKSII